MNTQTQMSQDEAVFQAFSNVIGDFEGKLEPTKEQRAEVTEILVEGFKAGRIALKDTPNNRAKLADESKLRSYCSGLQSNWLRKDKRLNGGVKYVAKNPGSRAGSTDATVKAMRTLLQLHPELDQTARAEIQAKIDARLAAIKPTKVTTLTPEQVEILKAAGLDHFVES